jgi:hypothetical protein
MEYYVDFSGYFRVEADSEEDALARVRNFLDATPLPDEFVDNTWDLENVEACPFPSPIGTVE